MSLLADVRRAVAARIEQYDSKLNVFAYPPETYVCPAVLIQPASAPYIAYHRTNGPSGLLEVNLIATVVVPEGQSTQSAQEVLDGLLSSGDLEDMALADAISSNEVAIGSVTASVYVGEAVNLYRGILPGGAGGDIKTVSADLPIVVRLNRSAA